ncbi:hypothetical protein B0T17DRAFT_543739 [Bombardia bombarda]|uniref:Secreted protein n=1 Tax=Bombardia bombarda TaxID=252184 RepID=A0AA39U756_9PEZI|nr:hypothetical protein B0T17DRAFT_543739 [Bombardia bombarda]
MHNLSVMYWLAIQVVFAIGVEVKGLAYFEEAEVVFVVAVGGKEAHALGFLLSGVVVGRHGVTISWRCLAWGDGERKTTTLSEESI